MCVYVRVTGCFLECVTIAVQEVSNCSAPQQHLCFLYVRACVCVCEGQILTQSICTITFVTFLSFESDLMLVANFQRESRQLTHKHLAARSDKDNKEKQVTGTVCVGVCERASALTQCVSVFVIQPSQRKQSLSSIPLLSPSSPSLSLLETVS